jgi:hypothetical protein
MPGDPHSGSKVWKASDREIGKPGENRGKVLSNSCVGQTYMDAPALPSLQSMMIER